METKPSFLNRWFKYIISRRYWVIAIYALLLIPGAYLSLDIPQDNSIDRLMVQTDPEYQKNKEFMDVFGVADYLSFFFDAPDPFNPTVIIEVKEFVNKLWRLKLQKGLAFDINSLVTTYEKIPGMGVLPGLGLAEEENLVRALGLKKFSTGTQLFAEKGLYGKNFMAVFVTIPSYNSEERNSLLTGIDEILESLQESFPDGAKNVRKVGQAYINKYLDLDTKSAGKKYFPLFGLFVVILTLILYRSLRTLLVFVVCLLASVVLTNAYVALIGGVFTIVSSLVPMTILTTCTATLVYLQSRFVDCPNAADVEQHRLFAFENKFLACTASIIAAAVGFAALYVSKIRPIRDMGHYVAIGLIITWVIVFTLFPALQRALKTPVHQQKAEDQGYYVKLSRWLPLWSYKYRYLLVFFAISWCVIGAVCLLGVPGMLKGMNLETNALEYMDKSNPLYKDAKSLDPDGKGVSVFEIWLDGRKPKGELGPVLDDPETALGIFYFQNQLIDPNKKDAKIRSVSGLYDFLRLVRYSTGQGDQIRLDKQTLEPILEQWIDNKDISADLRKFLKPGEINQTRIMVVSRALSYEEFQLIKKDIESRFESAAKLYPQLRLFKLSLVGTAVLQAKVSFYMVPTLTESLLITVVLIFIAFLVVFRSGPARVMAMIPSLFAILAMFALMRVFGMTLNIATILIASTVLGSSENDQVHFFYHYQEGKKNGTTEQALVHTLVVAGRAIFMATLINAGGFLAFVFASLPPIRQFGTLSSLAFVLSMLADFTALPAALWLVFRDKPDSLKASHQ